MSVLSLGYTRRTESITSARMMRGCEDAGFYFSAYYNHKSRSHTHRGNHGTSPLGSSRIKCRNVDLLLQLWLRRRRNNRTHVYCHCHCYCHYRRPGYPWKMVHRCYNLWLHANLPYSLCFRFSHALDAAAGEVCPQAPYIPSVLISVGQLRQRSSVHHFHRLHSHHLHVSQLASSFPQQMR